MWLPGHIAFSFLVCLPFIIYLKRERALALVCLGAFALLPDYLHLGMLRAYAHSLLGVTALLVVSLVVLILLVRPRPALIGLAIVAAFSHLLADLYVGSIWPFYPWSSEWFQLNEFNMPFDIRVEVVLFAISALIVLVLLRPWEAVRSVRSYDRGQRNMLLLLTLPVGAMAGLQAVYFAIVSTGPGLDLYRSLLLVFMIITFLAAAVLFLTALRQRAAGSVSREKTTKGGFVGWMRNI
jgi:hypothetical protein